MVKFTETKNGIWRLQGWVGAGRMRGYSLTGTELQVRKIKVLEMEGGDGCPTM